MTRYDEYTLSVCVDCAQLIANGEINDGTDAAEVCAAGQARIWGTDAVHLSLNCPEDCEGEFSWRDCDGCGSTLGGDRHPAVALIPKEN